MRNYDFTAMRPGGYMNWPGQHVTASAKIRAVVIIMFRKWFGHDPCFHWHADGFMAEAWDNRGNKVQLSQTNRDMRPIALLPAHIEETA